MRHRYRNKFRYNLPRLPLLTLARAADAKFPFGSNAKEIREGTYGFSKARYSGLSST